MIDHQLEMSRFEAARLQRILVQKTREVEALRVRVALRRARLAARAAAAERVAADEMAARENDDKDGNNVDVAVKDKVKGNSTDDDNAQS